jgi:hypothetical protein
LIDELRVIIICLVGFHLLLTGVCVFSCLLFYTFSI